MKYTFLIAFLFESACAPSTEQAEQSITTESLLEPVEVLASDEFEGRAPATRGEDLPLNGKFI